MCVLLLLQCQQDEKQQLPIKGGNKLDFEVNVKKCSVSKSQRGSRLQIQHGGSQIKQDWFHVIWLGQDSWEEAASFNVSIQSGYAAGEGIAT